MFDCGHLSHGSETRPILRNCFSPVDGPRNTLCINFHSHIFQLRDRLHTITKGTKTMAEYLYEVSTIITALDTVSEIIPEKHLVMCVVRGLPSAYSSTKQAVRISPTPVDLATLSSWLKSEDINVDLESKLLLREAAVMEPATALIASQNYRGGRGGGWQGSRGGYDRNSGGRGRDGRQGSRLSYDDQQQQPALLRQRRAVIFQRRAGQLRAGSSNLSNLSENRTYCCSLLVSV